MSEKRGDDDRSERKQPHCSNVESPEKVQPKRAKPDSAGTPSIDVGLTSSSSPSSAGERLPLWVAGSSPAKFVALDDIIKINSHIEKMAIVHEIAVEPRFSVENLQRGDRLYTAVKHNMHKAYWDMLRADLAKNPSNYTFALQLLADLKKAIREQFSTGNLNNAICAIDEILNLNHLRQRYEQGALDFRHVLRLIVQVLERLCAPIRDELVARLKAEEDLVDLFSGVFELVELMETDMANFALSQNRGTIESYSAQIERDEFMKALEIDPNGSHYTDRWLRYILDKSSLCGTRTSAALPVKKAGGSGSHIGPAAATVQPMAEPFDGPKTCSSSFATPSQPTKSPSAPTQPTKQLSDTQIRDLVIDLYLTLLEMNPLDNGGSPVDPELRAHFPETLALDRVRLLALGEKHLQLELVVGALFVASNLAGRRACDALPDLKPALKNELIVILNDVSWSNHLEKLENVYVQCDKNLKAVNPLLLEWNDEKSALLCQQIVNLGEWNDSIRQIARARIRGFLHLILRRDGEQQIRLPPGLSVVQSELAALASRLNAILAHNWNAFGELYADRLRRAYESGRPQQS